MSYTLHGLLFCMTQKRKLHLNAFMRPATIHTGGWRYPGSYADANFNLHHITQFIKKLEQGRFDTFFMADHLAVLNMPMEALKRSATPTSFERPARPAADRPWSGSAGC